MRREQRRRAPWGRWLGGLVCATLVVWAGSALFLDSVTPLDWDPALGRYVRRAGVVVRQRSEGWAETHVGAHGLTEDDARALAAPGPKFILWGDSYANALMVNDHEKAMAVFNRIATDLPLRGVMVGGGGLSVADYYFSMPQYTRLAPDIIGHVILISGFKDVIPGIFNGCNNRFLDNPLRLEASECAPSPLALRTAPIIYGLRLDFLFHTYRKLKDYAFRFAVGPLPRSTKSPLPAPSLAELEQDWRFLLGKLKEQAHGFLVFVYSARAPYIEGGKVIYEDPEADRKALFGTVCKDMGVGFVDLAAPYRDLYDREGLMTSGFINTPHRGAGHLTARAQEIIATSLHDWFRKELPQ